MTRPDTLFPYSSRHRRDCWDILKEADADPDRPGNVVLLYSRRSIPHGARGDEYRAGWTREHVFCQSYLGPDATTSRPGVATDCHNLFAADQSVNSSRSNKMLDDGGRRVTDQEPDSGDVVRLEARADRDSFEPPDAAKGACARAAMYVAHTYGLRLGEECDAAACRMGRLSTLLRWHREHPPCAWERRRNDVVARYQGNRNEFVDDPGLADRVQWAAEPAPSPHPSILLTPFLNELHYDNAGRDVDEGVELCVDLAQDEREISVVLYNGSNGRPYRVLNDFEPGARYERAGIKLLHCCCRGIQNGGRDGVAIVSRDGVVCEFLSYEGTLEATAGPCEGMRSVDMGVAETGSTPPGTSLQRVGTGLIAKDFRWTIGAAQGFGEKNDGQWFN